MPQKPDSVIILGTGAYVPENRVTNDDMAQRVETSDEWIRTRTGIQARHFADDTQASSDLACEAARQALAAASASPDSIDLLIVATMTPDMPFPSTACLVQSKLGLGKICAFDLQAACSGFVYALSVALRAVWRRGQCRLARPVRPARRRHTGRCNRIRWL